MPPKRSGVSVFVGNINYDATEDQLKDIFAQVGNVVSFRVVYDQTTGQPKGYGFCEYEDKETAMSARRNLNGYELNGRQLRVDFTESDKTGGAGAGAGAPGRNSATAGPALPDALSGPNPSLAMLSVAQLHSVMLQLKRAVAHFPDETREMFAKNPQLAHAVLQGQILLGMVPLPPPPQAQQQQQAPPPQQQQQQQHGQQQQQQQQQQQMQPQGLPPQGMPGMPMMPGMPGGGDGGMPPPPGMGMMGMGNQGIGGQEAALLKQVLEMTPQQIEALSAEEREQVLQVQRAAREQQIGASR